MCESKQKSMKPIPVKTEILLEVDDLCDSMGMEDLVGLISHVANVFADKRSGDFRDRRHVIETIEDHLSEAGRRFIGELAGCIYARAPQRDADHA